MLKHIVKKVSDKSRVKKGKGKGQEKGWRRTSDIEMKISLNASYVKTMINEFNISTVQTIWLYSVESASKRTIPMKDAL